MLTQNNLNDELGYSKKHNKKRPFFQTIFLVRTRRLELPRPNGHQPLKLARLPIPPRARIDIERKDRALCANRKLICRF